jgi:hypothetical protein
LKFIFILVIIGYSLSNSKSVKTWPSVLANCPDYWENVSTDDENIICSNVKSIGTCNIQGDSGENNKIFPKNQTLCDKYKWANTCGLSWDGVTYGYGEYKPCDTKQPAPGAYN